MKEHICQIVSREKLVAYLDGELSSSETEQIAEHIATCPDCQAMAEALKRSLQLTQAIWQTSQVQWRKTRSFCRSMLSIRPSRRLAAIAAGVLLVLAVGATWRLLFEPSTSRRTHVIGEEEKVAELRLKIADSGDAARLLAAAELLSKYPEAESSVEERYRHIVERYPETVAATKAKLKIN